MKNRDAIQLLQLFLFACMIITAVGCVPRNRAYYTSTDGTAVYTGNNPVTVDTGTRRYYRDENGRLYNVDPKVGLRVIERKVRVENRSDGLFTIVDDNNIRYYYDDTGRLYYRDNSGNIVYIEDSGEGKVIDPLPILRGDYSGRSMRLRDPGYCTNEWRQCMNSCNSTANLGNKRNCLEDCDYSREQCLMPY